MITELTGFGLTVIVAVPAMPSLVAVIVGVAFARLYRGMHYVTDVAAGIVDGIVCMLLAYGWYRHRSLPHAGHQVSGEPVHD